MKPDARPVCVALMALVLLAGCSPLRGIEAFQVLRDIADPAAHGRPAVRPVTVRYSANGKVRSADLYRPSGARAGLVLVPGAARRGKDDPRLTAFAQALARARFAVLVPDIENVRHLRLGPEDAAEIGHAVRQLGARTEGGVGLVAISYAAGPAILAAMDPETGRHVRFVLAIGGYYDIEAAVTFFTAGFFRDPATGAWRHRRPNPYGKWVFVRGNAERLDDPSDRVALTEMAERRLRDPRAPIADIVPRLGAEGRAVHALLANRDPERVPALIAALPARILADMRALDLKGRDFGKLSGRLILVHGRDDPIIPHSESAALAKAAGARASLYIADRMAHTELGAPGLGDTLTLWQAVYEVLSERNAMAPPRPPLGDDPQRSHTFKRP